MPPRKVIGVSIPLGNRKALTKYFAKRHTRTYRQKQLQNNSANRNALQKGILFKDNLTTMFPYVDNKLISFASGVPTIQVYRLNSLYDPDYTGVGSQPMYFDNLLGANSGTAPYNNYKVISVKYRFDITNANTQGSSVGRVSVTFCTDTIAYPSTLEEAMMNSNTRVTGVIMPLAGSATKRLSGFISMKQALGTFYNDNNCTAPYSGNPSTVYWAVIQVWPADETAGSYSYILNTVLNYKAKLNVRNVQDIQ